MLAKLAVLLSKVPHYAFVLALLVTSWGPQILPSLTGPLAPWVPYVTGAVAFATAILGLAKQFNPGTTAAVASDKAIIAKVATA